MLNYLIFIFSGFYNIYKNTKIDFWQTKVARVTGHRHGSQTMPEAPTLVTDDTNLISMCLWPMLLDKKNTRPRSSISHGHQSGSMTDDRVVHDLLVEWSSINAHPTSHEYWSGYVTNTWRIHDPRSMWSTSHDRETHNPWSRLFSTQYMTHM